MIAISVYNWSTNAGMVRASHHQIVKGSRQMFKVRDGSGEHKRQEYLHIIYYYTIKDIYTSFTVT